MGVSRIGSSPYPDYNVQKNMTNGDAEKSSPDVAEDVKETDPIFQLGARTYTQSEWDRMMAKVDRHIECVKREQKEHVKQLDKAKQIKKQDKENKIKEERLKKILKEYDDKKYRDAKRWNRSR